MQIIDVGAHHCFALASDGCLYYIPGGANRVLKFDPASGTRELIGGELDGGAQWGGAFPGPEGCVYGVPHDDKQLLRIDPVAGTVARFGPPLQDKDRKKLIKDVSFRTSAQFDAIKDELKASSVYATIQDRDTDALWTRGDCGCDPILSASHFHR